MAVQRKRSVSKSFGVCVVLVVALSGCSTEGLAFKQDKRVSFVSPRYREKVTSPVVVDWELNDFELGTPTDEGTPTQFGVYVDIDPQPPDEPLAYFARDDEACLRSKSCPDEKYLQRMGVHVTDDTEMAFNNLPPAPGVDVEGGDPDVHEVTLVFLDTDGRRVGESAWAIIFEIVSQED